MNIESIFNHLNENLSKINELYNTKNSDINLIKNKYFLFLSNKFELKKNNYFKFEKESDICIGFQTNEDCMIKILYKNNILYENIECKKHKIILLKNPIFFISSFYEDFYIISDKNIELNILHMFVSNDLRLNLAQNDFYYKNKSYFRGFISSLEKKKYI